MLIGFVMCISLIFQCSKKKQEKSSQSPHGSKNFLEQSVILSPKNKRKSLEAKKSGEDVQKSDKKSGKSGDGKKAKSKQGKNGSKKSGKTGEKGSSSRKKKTTGQAKTTDGVPNGQIQNEPNSENKEEIPDAINYDDIKEKMQTTIEETDNPAVHERVTRVAATDMIFDPKMVAYKGNVDNEKDPKEEEELERELMAACDKHEARFKDIRKLEERDPNFRRPRSPETEKSIDKRAPVPHDQRIKMRPDQCVLYETKDQITEDSEPDPDAAPVENSLGSRYSYLP
ncbi:hypothetical protein CAEBREN_11464 [Caenorhabditis brenneri]|uniref:Uncharacterized protein n=1 Tax=Caenorhabditis brenneri TaxID=135651 RepID=G0MDZ0_CAEBE|nr:hypothetical protein CAEBREN_11464 [Caenorhabditis brenneri]